MAQERERREQILEADGLRIRYIEAGNGKPIVVVAGGADGLADPLLAKLSESHRTICIKAAALEDLSQNQLGEKLPNGLTRLGIELCSVIGIQSGARVALALAIEAPEPIDRLILISPQLTLAGAELPELTAVKAATLVLIGTSNRPGATEAGRLCREKIPSCHLSFVYGADDMLVGNLGAWLDPIVQFLEEGEQFIIFRRSQLIRPEN